MKNKNNKITFELFGIKELDPFQMIARLFSYANPLTYKKKLHELFAEYNNSTTPKWSTISLLEFKDIITQFVNVAYYLHLENYVSKVEVQDLKIFECPYFTCYNEATEIWENRPTHLNLEEYKKSHLVFSKAFEIFKYKTILKKFYIVFYNATSTNNHNNYNNKENLKVFQLYFLILSIIEASFLIDVRENIHYKGFLKQKYKSY